MKDEIRFNYHDFESYLFQAIEESRNLVCDDIFVEDVRRYLSLAMGEVDLFVQRLKKNKEEGMKGAQVIEEYFEQGGKSGLCITSDVIANSLYKDDWPKPSMAGLLNNILECLEGHEYMDDISGFTTIMEKYFIDPVHEEDIERVNRFRGLFINMIESIK